VSRKPENVFRASIHKHLPVKLYHMKTSNPYAGGVWDDWYSGEKDLWVEYKFIVLPALPTTMITPNLSKLQIEWGKGRYEEGRNLAVIVGCKEGGIVLTDRMWEARLSQENFVKRLMTRQELASWLVRKTGGVL